MQVKNSTHIKTDHLINLSAYEKLFAKTFVHNVRFRDKHA